MTQLVGNSAGTPVGGISQADGYITLQSFVATASGSATSGSFYYRNTFGVSRNFLIAVYDGSNNLLGTSQQGATGTSDGFKTVSFTTPITIVSGQTYKLALMSNDFLDWAATGTGEQTNSGDATFPTPPNPFVSNNSDNPGIMFITLDGSTSGAASPVPGRKYSPHFFF